MRNFSYLLGLFVVILAFVAYDLYDKNKQLERSVHAAYTNDLSTATEKLTALHRSVSQSLLFQDERALTTELDNIWRISGELRKSVSNLPLQDEVQTQWMRYLGRIGNAAKLTADSGDFNSWKATMEPVSANLNAFAEEWNVATVSFYENNGDFNKWPANKAMEIKDSPFLGASKQLKSYNETDFPLTASESDYEKKRDLEHLSDQPITKKQAIEQFKKYFPEISDAAITVTKSRDDAPYPFYHIQFIRGTRIGYADITEKGGHLLSFLMERPVAKSALSHEEILSTAKGFMKKVGYEDVELSESRENHEAWHLVFTRVYGEDKALVYPDSIQLKIAKDNAEILGINAMEYVQEEKIPQQATLPINWDDFFANNVKVEEVKNIYTADNTFTLRKCYEVIARIDNNFQDTFRIVIDAETHRVIKNEKMQ
ncbi:PepSY1/2 domain-containing protein [Solibacillus sp. FSL K6-1523]|uniref:PepSY1/2 domain-containing protein n=1 Tax=Solibacillus sp. FSL K6-1523 TaxID=2921471 RepID=UPI0030FC2BAC